MTKLFWSPELSYNQKGNRWSSRNSLPSRKQVGIVGQTRCLESSLGHPNQCESLKISSLPSWGLECQVEQWFPTLKQKVLWPLVWWRIVSNLLIFQTNTLPRLKWTSGYFVVAGAWYLPWVVYNFPVSRHNYSYSHSAGLFNSHYLQDFFKHIFFLHWNQTLLTNMFISWDFFCACQS